MSERVAAVIVVMAGAYVAAGVAFAAAFLTWRVSRIDPAARPGTLGFRLIILPGVIALWPLLLRKWCAR
jgi:hypothetical protein